MSALGWIGLGLGVLALWIGAGYGLGVLVGRVARGRDRQVPRGEREQEERMG